MSFDNPTNAGHVQKIVKTLLVSKEIKQHRSHMASKLFGSMTS